MKSVYFVFIILVKLLNIYRFTCERAPYQFVPASSVKKTHTFVLFAVVVHNSEDAAFVFACHFMVPPVKAKDKDPVEEGFVKYKTRVKAPEDGIPEALRLSVVAALDIVPYWTLPFDAAIMVVPDAIVPKLYADSV